MRRKLAAILAADLVGYTRLMGADEVGTLERLTSLRTTTLEPLIARHNGCIVKLMGDGLLVEFQSVVDGALCARDWQEAVRQAESEADVTSRLQFRIGLHLGDVIVEGNDIYGAGVNVAARLEGLAEPGGICLSEDAYRQVKGKIDIAFEDLGEQALKNVANPVRVYAVSSLSGLCESGAAQTSAERPRAGKPAIAVLPFKNLSGDREHEYFADGVSEDIISALSRNRWLVVIARSSSFAFKDQSVDLREAGRQLGASYMLEGSIRKGGDRVRVVAQLVDAISGREIWADRFDRVLEDIFKVQDEVTEAIVSAIAPELGKAEQLRATSKQPDSLDAWDIYQRGMWHLYKRTKQDLKESRALFEAALAIDPAFSLAYSALVDAYYYEVVLGLAESASANREEALKAGRRAVELDPDDAAAYCAMGKARIVRLEHTEAIPELRRAIELNPSHAWAHYGLGAAAEFSGEAEAAIGHLLAAIRLSPRDQHMGSFMVRLAEAHLLKGDYQEAIEWAQKSLQQQGFQWSRYAALLAALGKLGDAPRAEKVLRECLSQRPDFSVSLVRASHLFTDATAMDHYLDGLRAAGVPE